jgi:hypothetical protein
MPLLKRLSQLSIVILLFTVVAISFHHHGDMVDHPDCPVCKLAKACSAVKKPAQSLFSEHICKASHDISAGEQPAPAQLSLPEIVKSEHVANNENCRQTMLSHTVPSRASPLPPCSIV